MTELFIHRFLKTAAVYPSAVAIRQGTQDVTYAELAARAAAGGACLTAQGIGPEDRIGLKFEKSADYIAALLGVWHAGAAFIPLPPSLPAERADYICKDADIGLTLSAAAFPACGREAAASAPENLAYIFYTSGSTGAPKGVMVEQRGLLNVLDAQIRAFDIGPGDRSLFYLSISFDASISDIGVALLSGATLVIPDESALRDGPALIELMRAEKITHADLPPSLLKALHPRDMPQSLRCIVMGGEACPQDTVRQWAKKFRIVNVYGPTEATICTSLNICDAVAWTRPLIGDALPGVDYRIIEDELFIGGIQLARGYANQPALTAEKFVEIDGSRWYKTGDRVVQHDNGEIEFIGRIDRQFKLRGQLIAPEEIEARLAAHPAIRRAAVLKRAVYNEEALTAFIVTDDPGIVPALPEFLAATLPGWMAPQHFFILPALPATASGKTDYAALKNHPLADAKTRNQPETTLQKQLWAIWRGVLGHDDFGVDDAFYTVGGDSLGIIRLTLALDAAGFAASPGFLLSAPTIAGQAMKLAKPEDDGMDAALLRRDVAFDADFLNGLQSAARRPPVIQPPEHILLTGATGFLGARVLHGLLRGTSARMYCLVRAPDAAAGLQRIRLALADQGLDYTADDIARLAILPGDLKTGIDPALADVIDTIYHCAARVNMVDGYDALRADNVAAVQDILRFALTGQRKVLHYASTLSVFVATDRNRGRLLESDRLENVRRVYGGYAQSKFAAEYMLLQVPPAACDIFCYRLGLITGDSKTGIGAKHDFLAMFARGLAQLGAAPDGFDDQLFVDATPVDYAAAAMLRLARNAAPGIYHIANPQALSFGGLRAALRDSGKSIQSLPPPHWSALTSQLPLRIDETAAVLVLCRCGGDFARHRVMDLFQATDVVFDTSKTQEALAGSGILCPPPDHTLVESYMRNAFAGEKKLPSICLFGPESTGKSTLAKKLAVFYGGDVVPEYAYAHIAKNNGQVAVDDIPLIAAGQRALENAARDTAQKILFCDTDLLTTLIWSERLFGACPDWIRVAADIPRYDLYLLMDINAPWQDDIHRLLPDDRAGFMTKCEGELIRRGLPYIKLSGTWDEKFAAACAAVDAVLRA